MCNQSNNLLDRLGLILYLEVGNMIGKGYTVKSAMMEMSMVAEGYYATKSAYELNKAKGNKKAKTPIINAVYEVLYEGKSPKKVFKKLTDKLN